MRHTLSLILISLLSLAPATRAQDDNTLVEITPEARAAIERGLAFLAKTQNDDGNFGGERYGKHVGITSLACLAFMADGHMPDRGPHGQTLSKGLAFVINSSSDAGLLAAANTSHGPMYGHGFATLFLGEVYGMTPNRDTRRTLQKAVRLIVASQNHQGGWRYQPVPADADISVTICQIMALRSARNAGLSVPKNTIDRAVEYVRNCQNPDDGGFRYMIGSGGSAFPRSAAGLASLYYAGIYEGDEVASALAYLERQRPGTPQASRGGYYYYGHYYAAQAMFLAGGEHWKQWYPAIREELLARQQPDGSWNGNHGTTYSTAMSLIILQMPNRLLPIFER
ncbi:prenyltransferase/squalene oxidase repeat-containing protein [Mucisphaera calidilacus]|uniref:Prenyltransferase and squalene oxidase repeat protein n=1 Tax=Mucisphaera calidilacus TaxID=2527982 RepID=A0A518C0W4_9BACT|nr:prenyltransferase/squalene oxidase repeat-containing protein [Mucisphaera calidilacus]QDU72872.1 Prenyltransferase and squalene oxidase repeat protein [Mucisphaera calidilacus]